MTWIRSNALAVLAIVIALSSGAYAVSTAPKDSVVSKSIRNGAVKGKDLAANSVDASKIKNGQVKSVDVANGTLTGADIDESSLNLPAEHTEMVAYRLPPNTPTTVISQHNGLTVEAGCVGVGDQLNVQVTQEAGVGVRELAGNTDAFLGPQTDAPLYGLQDGYLYVRYVYRRASDGAAVWLDLYVYNWNGSSPPTPIENDDCLFWLRTTYT